MKTTSLEVLNNFIERGQPPDFMALEYDTKGVRHTVFTWNCGTILKVNGDCLFNYADALRRFLDFWK